MSSKGFYFRNPGMMRVPAEIALEGGESDCRNQTLHKLFLLLGLGERAGSGNFHLVRPVFPAHLVPRIIRWKGILLVGDVGGLLI
ncbi:MAG: hypothetical protein HQK83_20105 [Fibrobacteria bacterium]|nr:hypothetical protein [Fibrobacteria bacterium]